ncbi:MAG: MFS transporter, partial [Chloroflexi bacterium]|nr:MFS transporter [Chloroflexota bacterium]
MDEQPFGKLRTGMGRMRSYAALTAVFAGVFVAADDQTVVVTVLPQIMLDLKLTVTELDHTSWIITGYLLGYVAAMPFIGRLSDIWGHRNAFIGSLVLFMLGSVGVALATDINWLIGLRVFQALGAGALVPIAIAVVGDLFPPENRGTPLGLVGASAEAGGVIGPLWGGVITKYLAWQWVFWLNIPLCAVIIAMTLLLLPKSQRYPARMDYIGGALVTLSLAALTLGLSRIDELDALMALWLALAVVSLTVFILRQRTVADPLLPRAMFRARAFVAANAVHLFIGGALIIGMVTIPLMANTLLGETPLGGGLMLLRMTVAIPFG